MIRGYEKGKVVDEGVRNGHHYTVKRLPLAYAEVYVLRTGTTVAEARSREEAASLLDKVLGDVVETDTSPTEEEK